MQLDSPHVRDPISSNGVAQIVSAPDGWSIVGPALTITLAGATYPGVNLDDPIADWQRYDDQRMVVHGVR